MNKEVKRLLAAGLVLLLGAGTCCASAEEADKALREAKEQMRARYGENKRITDDNYDKSLAVRCVNGTFVGRKTVSSRTRAFPLSADSLSGNCAGKRR